MSIFDLVRKKKAIAVKIEGLRDQSEDKGRCWGGLHLPKSIMFALLDALDHLHICLSIMYRRYEKTVLSLSLTAL